MGRQKPGCALAWRAGVAKQDRVVVGVQLPGGEEPPTTVQSDTPRHRVSDNAKQSVPVLCSTCAAP